MVEKTTFAAEGKAHRRDRGVRREWNSGSSKQRAATSDTVIEPKLRRKHQCLNPCTTPIIVLALNAGWNVDLAMRRME
jgi:hypothetical protein